jgi:hypothetical protein
MTTIRPRLKELIDLLSEMNRPPEAPSGLVKALDSYLRLLIAAQKKILEEEKWRNTLAELANMSEQAAKARIDTFTDTEFKAFCTTNRIAMGKARNEKKIKGKTLHKAISFKKATKGNPARMAVPAVKAPDTIIPALTARQVTTENILTHAFRLKSQATI